MEEKEKWRSVRAFAAYFFAFLLLAMVLPSTGAILDGPTRPGMWRCGPYQFYPDSFLLAVGVVVVPLAGVLVGIWRRNALEMVGWILLGILFLLAFTQ